MINAQNLSYIVRKTLNDMGIREPALEKLIKGTFTIESNLEELFDDTNKYHNTYGLMMMSKAEVIETYEEILRFNKILKKKIFTATSIDIDVISYERFAEVLKSNIGLMVAVCYSYYQAHYDGVPEDDLSEIAKYYTRYYVKEVDYDAEISFKSLYNSTFSNK